MTLINGKEYTDSEIMAVYRYQEQRFYEADIGQGIDNVVEADVEESRWLDDPGNIERVKKEACNRLDKWLDLQSEVLANVNASIMTLTEDLVYELYKEALKNDGKE